MQLVAYGAQDTYLTSVPQITFFKVVYRRHTNFSMEAIEQTLNGTADFGRTSTVTITRNGDLITKAYLMVLLPEVKPTVDADNCIDSKFAWVRRVGYAMLNYAEVQIGGSTIDKHYGIWLNIWYELARHAGDGERGFLKMIGDTPELTAYNSDMKKEYRLYIPLKFWFNRHAGLALPLIALQYHEVRIEFELNKVNTLYVANDDFKCVDCKGGANNGAANLHLLDAQVLVDYIYLDSEERRRFAQVGHEYLIEQVQFTGEESVTSNKKRTELYFNHPTKELVWAVQNGNFITGKKFPFYTNADDWTSQLNAAATKLLLESIVVLKATVVEVDEDGQTNMVTEGEAPPTCGTWDCFPPRCSYDCCETACTTNGKIRVVNNTTDKVVYVNTNAYAIGGDTSSNNAANRAGCPPCNGGNNPTRVLTDLICATVTVDSCGCQKACTGERGSGCEPNKDVKVSVCCLTTDITVRDLSFPVNQCTDSRACPDDPCVYEPFNFGVLIDGSGNPVSLAQIQLNGCDRFDEREGPYFNYVQPDQHHTNTPADGINVYSFALFPEQHQPSGSANLSRIDSTLLELTFADPTFCKDLPKLDLFGTDNKLHVFAFSYNVLRIMSGLGGLAYSS